MICFEFRFSNFWSKKWGFRSSTSYSFFNRFNDFLSDLGSFFEGPFFLDERDDIKVVSFEDEDISYINEITEEDPACEPAEESAEEQALAYSEMFDLAFP